MFYFRSLTIVFFESVLLTILLVGIFNAVYAEVRSSNNYQLQSDSVNFAGGLSESSNYSIESTAGEIATGNSTSTTYTLRAGYQQMQEIFLSLSGIDNVSLTPSLGGLTGGESDGSVSVVVLTDNPAGYELTLFSQNSPTMQSVLDNIADYIPISNPLPDFSFTTTATDAHFGFSPEGNDIVSEYRDNGLVCGSGSSDTVSSCWTGLTTAEKVIARGTANQPSGATTTVLFRVGIGNDASVLAGTYIATTTLTAIPL